MQHVRAECASHFRCCVECPCVGGEQKEGAGVTLFHALPGVHKLF